MFSHYLATMLMNNGNLRYKCYNIYCCAFDKLLSYSQYRALRIHAEANLASKIDARETVQDNLVKSCVERLRKHYCLVRDSEDVKDILAFRSKIPFWKLLEQLSFLNNEKDELILMKNESNDEEFCTMANTDLSRISEDSTLLESKILSELPSLSEDRGRQEVIVEICPGVGGQEAMLFAGELMNMYLNYCHYVRWSVDEDSEQTSGGGIRRGSLLVNGKGSYRQLKFESGIHRVQRTPKTEKMGRVHTSTVSVAILPVPSEIEVEIKETDVRIETRRASGAGGQHVNTTDSAIRMIHLATGTVVDCQENRSQLKNKQIAFNKLRSKLYQEKVDAENSKLYSNRKLQVGTKGRSEKIRTYNYNQDRVTDHRVPVTYHNVSSMLLGQEHLAKLINRLEAVSNLEMLVDLVDSYVKDDK